MSGSSAFLLAVDVGNSRVKCGLFEQPVTARPGELPRCLHGHSLPVDADFLWNTIDGWLEDDPDRSLAGVIAGANPDGVAKMRENWPNDGREAPQVIGDPRRFPLQVNLPAAEKVGIDRLLNAVAANVVRPQGRSAIIVDCGTATTVDYLSPAGAFEGGAILPGFELSARALHRYTALLPLIDVEDLNGPLPEALGRNTRDALKSGLFWGQLGAIKEIIERLSQPQSESDSPFLLLTGGGSALLKPHLPHARWEPRLTLQGLALITAEPTP